jgi:anti-sigma-K factor RskA
MPSSTAWLVGIASVDQDPAALRMILGSRALQDTLKVLKERVAGFESRSTSRAPGATTSAGCQTPIRSSAMSSTSARYSTTSANTTRSGGWRSAVVFRLSNGLRAD